MDYAFLTIFPGEIKLGSLLDFDHVWVGEDLYQIWCFIQNLHYGCAYTPHYPSSALWKVDLFALFAVKF